MTANQWAESDPRAALGWLQQLPDEKLRLAQTNWVLGTWAANDPQAALDHALNAAESTGRAAAISCVIRGVARTNVEAAIEMLAQLPESARTHSALEIVGENAQKDPEAVADLLLSLPPSMQRNDAGNIARYFAGKDITRALAWVEQLGSDDARRSATEDIMHTVFLKDPKSAAELYTKNPTGGQGYQMFDQAVASWARNDAMNALNWARALPDEKLRDTAIRSSLRSMAESDPLKAANLVTSSLTGAAQATAFIQIASTWTGTDPHAALAWATQLPEAARGAAFGGVAGRWARSDPKAAAQWLDHIPAGQPRDSAVNAFAFGVCEADPASAAAWASTIGDPGKRDASLRQLFQSWLGQNKAAATAWLEQTTAISDTLRTQLQGTAR